VIVFLHRGNIRPQTEESLGQSHLSRGRLSRER
jgi:hypothetical protein